MADRSSGGLKKGERKRGPWTFEEDIRLISYITFNGEGRWEFLAKASGLNTSGRSCRLRWVNYLSPDLNHTNITPEEERLIVDLHARWGNKWSRIAQSLTGRTDNGIKNYWRTHLRKQFVLRKNASSKVDFESLTHSSSLSTSSEAPIGLERGTGKSKDPCMIQTKETQQHDVICTFQPNRIPIMTYEFEYEDQNSTAPDGVQFGAALAQEEYSTDSAYNFSVEFCSSELYRKGELGYCLYNTLSPETLSDRQFYSDQLWNMDDQNHCLVNSAPE